MAIQSTTTTPQIPSGVRSTTTKVASSPGVQRAMNPSSQPISPRLAGKIRIATFDGKTTIPHDWQARVSHLERNINAAYHALLNKPDLTLSIPDAYGQAVDVKTRELAELALGVQINVYSTADPYGQNAAGRSVIDTQKHSIELYAGTFFGARLHSPVSDWGQQLEFLHELIHQTKVGVGGANHNEDFQKALAPVIGGGSYYQTTR
jgi:hypothetical protein